MIKYYQHSAFGLTKKNSYIPIFWHPPYFSFRSIQFSLALCFSTGNTNARGRKCNSNSRKRNISWDYENLYCVCVTGLTSDWARLFPLVKGTLIDTLEWERPLVWGICYQLQAAVTIPWAHLKSFLSHCRRRGERWLLLRVWQWLFVLTLHFNLKGL
jgi:hypothetical protein